MVDNEQKNGLGADVGPETPLNNHLPPKTPIGQIYANTQYTQQIIAGLKWETTEQFNRCEDAQAALKDFENKELHALRKVFEE